MDNAVEIRCRDREYISIAEHFDGLNEGSVVIVFDKTQGLRGYVVE